jgi:peptide-methionine (S)-S-oxide reductase
MSVQSLSLIVSPFLSSALVSQTGKTQLASSLKHELPLDKSVFTSSFPAAPAPSPARMMEKKEGGGRRFLSMLGFGTRGSSSAADTDPTTAGIAQGPDNDTPAPGQQFATFGAGCFWGVELAYQRVPGVTKTEVGYTQGYTHNPSYNDVCSGTTGRNVPLSLSLFSQNHD